MILLQSGVSAMRAEELAKHIRVLVLDCDGVLTDGGLYYDENGNFAKRFDVQDGLGIKVAQEAGIVVAVITGLNSPAVKKRVEDLGIDDYYAGFLDKLDSIDEIRRKYDCEWRNMAYLGDDWVDIKPMQRVGLPMAVANAQPEVIDLAKLVTKCEGGKGAVREAIRFILNAKGQLKQAVARWSE